LQPIAEKNPADLTNLISLGFASLTLKIDQLPDARSPEDVVAATSSLLKSQLVE